MKYIAMIDDREYHVEILDDDKVSLDGVTYDVDFESIGGQPVYSLLINGRSFEAHIVAGEDAWKVMLQGTLHTIKVEDERERRLRAAGGGRVAEKGDFHLKAPMPGLVVAVPVEEGEEVAEGDTLVILESMKMQNELRSPRAGVVTRVRVGAGDSVDQKQTMLSVE
jgi:biotin carboxyl carrier protein